MSRKYRVPLEDRCRVKGCYAEYEFTYLTRGICEWHWDELADDVPALYEALKVPKRLRDPKYAEERLSKCKHTVGLVSPR